MIVMNQIYKRIRFLYSLMLFMSTIVLFYHIYYQATFCPCSCNCSPFNDLILFEFGILGFISIIILIILMIKEKIEEKKRMKNEQKRI